MPRYAHDIFCRRGYGWNSLPPPAIRSLNDTKSLKSELKTYLFSTYVASIYHCGIVVGIM